MRRLALILAAALMLAPDGGSRAENVDPGNDGHKYAWSENAGWINAKPAGTGGAGMHVGDFWVTGWMWAENLGWINLNCLNRGTCDAAGWGVRHDGCGNLAGFAWSENAGWIDFAPTGGGVRIVDHGAYRALAGFAWSENVGWINFIPAGTGESGIRVAWACDPALPVPTGWPTLTFAAGTHASLTWTALANASAYDVVRGDVRGLLTHAGDFSRSGAACISRRQSGTSLESAATNDVPSAGNAFWYLVRGANCNGAGTYQDDRPSPPGPRDTGIQASGGNCG